MGPIFGFSLLPARVTRLLATAALLAGVACGLPGCFPEAPPLLSPAQGGRPWSQLESTHFTMYTDVPADIARLTLADFEIDYGRLAAVLPHPEEAPGRRIGIVLFERRDDYLELTRVPKTTGAFFRNRLRGDIEDAPTLVLVRGESFSVEARTTFLHELTHRFLRQRSARLPRWLDEGLAGYYSTLRVAGDRLVLGAPPRGPRFADWWQNDQAAAALGRVPMRAAPSVPDLLAAAPEKFTATTHEEPTAADRQMQAALYAAAYRLVHLLRTGDPARFDAFVAAIERGMGAGQAFAAAFGDPASPALDERYRRYLTIDDLRTMDVPFVPARGVPQAIARAMSSGEVLVLWSRLRPWRPATLADVQRDLDQAVRLDRGSTETRYRRGLFALHQGNLPGAVRDLDAALAAAPREPRYLLARARWGMLVARSGSTDPSLLAVLGALAQTATSPAQLNQVAWALAMLGRPAEGLPFIDRALAGDRTCYACEDTRAVLLFALGRVPEALTAMDRAIALLPDDHVAPTYVRRLRALQLAAPLLTAPGRAPTEILRAVAQHHAAALRACPEQSSRFVPVRASIGPEGAVRAAWPAPPMTDERAVACTLRVVRGMVFPPFQGQAIEVTIPPG